MKVVVVGGGVIGLWCARELADAGASVTVLDGADQAAASAPASAGWLVPMLSSPLSGPGVLVHAARQMLRGEAAFGFRGLSPELARWLWSFVRSGSGPRFREGLRATLELAAGCAPAYTALRTSAPELELHTAGLLMVARTPAGVREAAELAENAAVAGYDGKWEELDRARLLELEPALAPEVAGGVHARDELHVQPEVLLAVLTRDAVTRGVTLRRAAVRSIEPGTSSRWSVVSADGPIAADQVVVAAGYWSKAILATLGVRLPLQSAAGFSITATGPVPPSHPLKLLEANVAVTPFDDGVRLAGRFALGRPPSRVSHRQLDRVVRAAAPYLRAWRPTSVSAQHVGLRPATPDSLPLIGEVPGQPGIIAATGHGMLGLTLAPGTAAEVRHQVTTGSPSEVGRPFAVDRFRAQRGDFAG